MSALVPKPEQPVTDSERPSWLGALLVNRVAAYWRQRWVPDVIALPDESKKAIGHDQNSD